MGMFKKFVLTLLILLIFSIGQAAEFDTLKVQDLTSCNIIVTDGDGQTTCGTDDDIPDASDWSEANLESSLSDATDVYTDNDFTANYTDWDTAYSWGDHSGSGYMTKPVYDSDDSGTVDSSEDLTCADCIGGTEIDESTVDHDGLNNFVANEHLDWTQDRGSTNIHAGNYTDTDTQLSEEEVEDYAGGMVSGGTETRIEVTYTDGGVGAGVFNFVVDDMNDDQPDDDSEVPNDITVDDYMEDEDVNTFSELQSWVSDETLLKAGTLTDTKYCIWDDGNGDIVCDSEGGGGGDSWGDAVDADIIPDGADSTYDLGANTPEYFANSFVDRMYLNNTAYLDGADAGKINLIAGSAIDYIQFYSSGNVPYISTVGDTSLKILSDGGYVYIGNATAAYFSADGKLTAIPAYTDVEGQGAQFIPSSSANNANSTVYGIKGYVAVMGDSFTDPGANRGNSTGLSYGNALTWTIDDGGGGQADWRGVGLEVFGIAGYDASGFGEINALEVTGITAQAIDCLGIPTFAHGYDMTFDNTYGIKILPASTIDARVYTITNAYELWIGKPTKATNNYQVYLEGTGAGSGIWFGDASHRAYSDGTDFYITGLTDASATPLEYNTSTKKITYDSSARKHKEDISYFSDDFRKLLNVQPKRYTRKSDGTNEIGYIADDLHDLRLNNLVGYKDGEPEYINRKTVQLYMLEIIKDHDKRIKRLEVVVCVLSAVLLLFLLYFFIFHVRQKCQSRT